MPTKVPNHVSPGLRVEKLVSGGQTGADRAALDFARRRGVPHGGWCPRGRWAEDGPIARRYHLTETPRRTPAQRTEWNVRDTDGTAIFSIAQRLAGGSKKTAAFARQYAKPCLHLSRERDGLRAAALLCRFLAQYRIRVLNVAGPRRSSEPQVARFTREVLAKVLRRGPAGRKQRAVRMKTRDTGCVLDSLSGRI